MGAIVAFSSLLDWLISKEEEDRQKLKIIQWWSKLDEFSFEKAVKTSNIYFNNLFNFIFGKKAISWRCFIISSLLSLLSVVLIAVIFILLGQFDEGQFWYQDERLLLLIPISLILNIWVDYISLIETRYILRWSALFETRYLLLFLVADLLVTASLYIVPLILILYFQHSELSISFISAAKEVLRDIFYPPNGSEPHLQICVYSTFTTSILFFSYLVSTLVCKFIGLSRTRLMIFLEKLESSNHLFKAFGGFIATIIALIKSVLDIVNYFTG
jgi:hypothetical protein